MRGKTIVDLGACECRYALPSTGLSRRETTPPIQYFFCGAPTGLTPEGAEEPYCPEHKKLCHRGRGKDWHALAGMIEMTERYVRLARPPNDLALPIDEQVREEAERLIW